MLRPLSDLVYLWRDTSKINLDDTTQWLSSWYPHIRQRDQQENPQEQFWKSATIFRKIYKTRHISDMKRKRKIKKLKFDILK